MHNQDVDDLPTLGKRRGPRRRKISDRHWVDTRHITIHRYKLDNLLVWPANRVLLTFVILHTMWRDQEHPPESIEGWTSAQIRRRFGFNPDFRVIQRLYCPEIVQDAIDLYVGRAPFCEGAHAWAYQKGDGRCYHCSSPLDPSDFHIDHLYPVAKGGLGSNANLVPSCAGCNKRKGARL